MTAACLLNFSVATLLLGAGGNSLSLKCSEKAAHTLFLTFTAKLSSAVQKYEQTILSFENWLLEASYTFPKRYRSFEFFSESLFLRETL